MFRGVTLRGVQCSHVSTMPTVAKAIAPVVVNEGAQPVPVTAGKSDEENDE